LINTQKFSEVVTQYLGYAKERCFRDKILRAFDAADKLRITFVGEKITDVYRYVSGLGKPSKEFILATVKTDEEMFEGGIIAASKHGEFAEVCWHSSDTTPITKTRYVNDDLRKLFECYDMVDVAADGQFMRRLADLVRASDCVVVIDFGHGLMMPQAIDVVKHAKFLAVNCQTNAGNVGFNPITRYRKADFVCIDEQEARLATQKRSGTIISLGDYLCNLIDCDKFAITLGKQGCFAGWRGKPIARALNSDMIPAFSSRGLDTMGAGDAFLAVAAPLVATGLEVEAAAFAGNVAGAIKTTIVGHRRNVRRNELIQTIEALLA
jgi:bifunctional ADP-heptose synthase (sugar kinase/adenylyltransferase)